MYNLLYTKMRKKHKNFIGNALDQNSDSQSIHKEHTHTLGLG